mmetsp:Transcript_4764/g.14544  ORF Transcript_4764/g.14544 Transcript_4764/m.14544 type:complete len:618 (+) Transcript_4764:88-1941(+)
MSTLGTGDTHTHPLNEMHCSSNHSSSRYGVTLTAVMFFGVVVTLLSLAAISAATITPQGAASTVLSPPAVSITSLPDLGGPDGTELANFVAWPSEDSESESLSDLMVLLSTASDHLLLVRWLRWNTSASPARWTTRAELSYNITREMGEQLGWCQWRTGASGVQMSADVTRQRLYVGLEIYSPESHCSRFQLSKYAGGGILVLGIDVSSSSVGALRVAWSRPTVGSDLPEPYSPSVSYLTVDPSTGYVVSAGGYQGPTYFGGASIHIGVGDALTPYPVQPAAWDTATGYAAMQRPTDGAYVMVRGVGAVNENFLEGATSFGGQTVVSVQSVNALRWVFPGPSTQLFFPGGSPRLPFNSLLAVVNTAYTDQPYCGSVMSSFAYIQCERSRSMPELAAVNPLLEAEMRGNSLLLISWSKVPTPGQCWLGESPRGAWELSAEDAPSSVQVIGYLVEDNMAAYSLAVVPFRASTLSVRLQQTQVWSGRLFLFVDLIASSSTLSPNDQQSRCAQATARDQNGTALHTPLQICMPSSALAGSSMSAVMVVQLASGVPSAVWPLGEGCTGCLSFSKPVLLSSSNSSNSSFLATVAYHGDATLYGPTPLPACSTPPCSAALQVSF